MKEIFPPLHVHELSRESIPAAANDNVEAPARILSAANDNEIGLINQPSPETELHSAQLLSETRARLGLDVEAPQQEELDPIQTQPELPPIKPEEFQEILEQASAETAAGGEGQPPSEENPPQPETEKIVAGSPKETGNEGGGNKGYNEMPAGKRSSRVLKLLKLLAMPFLVLGGLISLAMTGVIKATNKTLELAKLTKGGGKTSGGSTKPSGGSVGHGGGGGH